MEEFIIIKVDVENIKVLALARDWESNIFSLKDLVSELGLVDGDIVLVDQLLQIGNKDNRFVQIEVFEGELNFYTCKIVYSENVPDELKKPISDYLRSNTKRLEYCFLPSYEKQQIANGEFI